MWHSPRRKVQRATSPRCSREHGDPVCTGPDHWGCRGTTVPVTGDIAGVRVAAAMGPASQRADASSCHRRLRSRRRHRETGAVSRGPAGRRGRRPAANAIPLKWPLSGHRRWFGVTMGAMSASDAAPLQCLDHSGQIVDGQPESTCAHPALPDAQDCHSSVRVPAEPHAPRVAPDVEENLAEPGQRGRIRCRHGPHRYPEPSSVSR